MSTRKEFLEKNLFNQVDDSVSAPISIRIPVVLNNELEELSITLDRSKSSLISEFIKAGIAETNSLLEEKSVIADEIHFDINHEKDHGNSLDRKVYMLNTNYNNDKDSHFDMLKNKEAAAFCEGWKEYILQLSKNDKVYLYQSGVGIIAVGVVDGELLKSEYDGVADDKFSKSLSDFKTGFKAISARSFKEITGCGANFRRTMVELSLMQASKIDEELNKIMFAL